jgi:hypothetical protein
VTDAPTDPSTDPVADRYGRPAPWQRRAVVVGSGLVGALALSWLAWTTVFHATPDVSSELVGWEVVDDHGVIVTVFVKLEGGDAIEIGASCQVQATAVDHTVVGSTSFTPDEGLNDVFLSTERRATSVESVGCTTPDQLRPR